MWYTEKLMWWLASEFFPCFEAELFDLCQLRRGASYIRKGLYLSVCQGIN